MKNRISRFLTVAAVTLAVTSGVAQPAGQLDPSFNSTGYVLPFYNDIPNDGRTIAMQPNGKIVVLGSGGRKFSLFRFHNDGSLDVSFGYGDGRSSSSFPDADQEEARGLAVLPDGRIIAVGWVRKPRIDGFDFGVAVVRFLPNGALDPSFGTGGKAFLRASGTDFFGHAVALRADGRILVGGKVNRYSGTGSDFLLLQLNTDGTLDGSFGGGNGWLATDFSTRDEEVTALALLPDGRIVASGAAYTLGSVNFALARYQPGGALDAVASYNFPSGRDDRANALALYPDGRALLAGSAGNFNFGFLGEAGAALRLRTDLNADTSFSGDGMYMLNFGLTSADEVRGVALQSDGKAVLVGRSSCCGLGLTRLNENGQPDPIFGSAGLVTLAVPGLYSTLGNAVMIDGDGRIVTSGAIDIGQSLPYAVVARFLGDVRPFGASIPPIPGLLDAENYDLGGQGRAYSDHSPGLNEATAPYQSGYRAGSGVDLETDTDGGNNVHLGYIRPGEWTQYSVQTPGALAGWRLRARVAASGSGGTFRLRVDGVDATGPVTIPNTGGWLAFRTIEVPSLTAIAAGAHTLRIEFLTAGANGTYVGNLNWFEITPSLPSGLSITATGTPRIITLTWVDPSRSLVLERTSSLTPIHWLPVTTGITYTPAINTYVETPGPGNTTGFFRLRSP